MRKTNKMSHKKNNFAPKSHDLEARMEVSRMEAKKIYRECLLQDEEGMTEDNLQKKGDPIAV